jgi:hypothetical protein
MKIICIRLFTFNGACVSVLDIVLSEGQCKIIGKLGLCPILKEDRWLVLV